jgi:hypothetical protein
MKETIEFRKAVRAIAIYDAVEVMEQVRSLSITAPEKEAVNRAIHEVKHLLEEQ